VKKCDLADDVKIVCWYVACVVHGCCLPNWIFEGIVFRPFPTFGEPTVYIPPNFVKIPWSGPRYAEIRNRPSGGGILLPDSILISVIFQGPSYVWSYKISKKSLTRGCVICDSTFSIHTFKPILSTAQWQSAIKQAIYSPQTNTTTFRDVPNGDAQPEFIPGAARVGSEAQPAAAIVNSPVCVCTGLPLTSVQLIRVTEIRYEKASRKSVTKLFFVKASEAENWTSVRRQYLTSFAGLHFENEPGVRCCRRSAEQTAVSKGAMVETLQWCDWSN